MTKDTTNITPPQPAVEEAEFNEGTTTEVVPKEKLRIAVTGNTYLADAMLAAFDPKVSEVQAYEATDMTGLAEYRPSVVFVCDDVPMLKNDSLDDAALIAAIQSVAQNTQAGICLKTTINTETLDRIINVVSIEWAASKMIYAPEFAETADAVLTSELSYVGGMPKAVDAYLNIIKHCTFFSSQEIVKGTFHEVIYAKLGLAGYKAVKQAFFSQFNQVVLDLEGANPTIVRRMIEKHPIMTDRSLLVPVVVRAKTDQEITAKQARSFMGEYANRDVKMFVGQSDRITLLEEAINVRNIKD